MDKPQKGVRIPLLVLVFALLAIHGLVLGLSDDEAYYWVLSQRPALGYAFHPPAVAWLIAFFQKTVGFIFESLPSGVVRLPAILGSVAILGLSLKWLHWTGLKENFKGRALLALLSFVGFSSSCWMMVPDIPLFVGWTLAFICCWKICFGKPSNWNYLGLSLGCGLAVLSKYSGILVLVSVLIALAFWASPSRRKKGWIVAVLGLVLALVPILIWNMTHQWASLLYQIHDRHEGASLSWIRYLRFWVVETLLAGPILLYFGFRGLKKAAERKESRERIFYRYLSVWILPPALVFLIQPLWSDFKLHWVFVVWWPMALALAWESGTENWRLIRYQVVYGISLMVLLLFSCHYPFISSLLQNRYPARFDPKWDVTNDLYGWKDLAVQMGARLSPDLKDLPVVGSRYQTAAQAAFSLRSMFSVTHLPREAKEWDEWPNLDVSEGQGPAWPKLKHPILFVTDIRYDAGPEFPDSICKKVNRFESYRSDILAKWIDLWRCDPR